MVATGLHAFSLALAGARMILTDEEKVRIAASVWMLGGGHAAAAVQCKTFATTRRGLDWEYAIELLARVERCMLERAARAG